MTDHKRVGEKSDWKCPACGDVAADTYVPADRDELLRAAELLEDFAGYAPPGDAGRMEKYEREHLAAGLRGTASRSHVHQAFESPRGDVATLDRVAAYDRLMARWDEVVRLYDIPSVHRKLVMGALGEVVQAFDSTMGPVPPPDKESGRG